ncbi:MAG: hypothetical protein R3C28_21615 [Pirellulaceae bacterium]
MDVATFFGSLGIEVANPDSETMLAKDSFPNSTVVSSIDLDKRIGSGRLSTLRTNAVDDDRFDRIGYGNIEFDELPKANDSYFRQCNHDPIAGSWRIDRMTKSVVCRYCCGFFKSVLARHQHSTIKANSQDAPTPQLF